MHIFTAPRRKRTSLACALSLAALAVSLATPATAQQTANAPAEHDYAIAAGSLDAALSSFIAEGGLSVVYDARLTQGKTTSGVRGRLSPNAALAQLLAGTGLTFRFNGSNAVTLMEAASGGDSGERVLGAVRVEGAQGYGLAGATSVNGINGSRDVTATEGTGSYTTGAMTVGSKAAESIKDVPASVSVLTNAQMQDQNITGIKSAMEKLPGVIAVNNGDTAHPTFYSRGFQITTFQIDGGAGLRTKGGTGNNDFILNPGGGTYVPQMDMSLYDHVEIIRGAAGTFNGFGDPGGVVNLVRKRPLDHAQLQVEGQLGSYELRRVSVDLTGAIAFGGALRGRLIATHQDNNFFYDVIHQDKNLISATLEYDLTPTTLVSVGGSYDRQKGGMWNVGLVRFIDGTALPLPRSACLCLPWARFDTKTAEGFAQVEQQVGSKWNLKYKITYQKQIQDSVSPYIDGAASRNSSIPTTFITYRDASHSQPRRWLQDLTLDGGFRLFGLEQKIVVGGNISLIDGKGTKIYATNLFPGANSSGGMQIINPLDYNPYDMRWANPGLGFVRSDSLYDTEKLVGAYIRADVQFVKNLHFLTAINYSSSNFKRRTFRRCTPRHVSLNIGGCTTVGAPWPNPDSLGFQNFTISGARNISWPPSTSFRYDLKKSLSIYATYADIYIDQSAFLTRDNQPLHPITGANFEGGIKWAPNSGKFNMNLSGYYTKQRNFASSDCHYQFMEDDPSWVPDDTPLCSGTEPGIGDTVNQLYGCCYKDNPTRENISFGADVDVSGQISRNWQISASYNFNKNISRDGSLDIVTGRPKPLISYSPRHLYKLSTSYQFADTSRLRGLDVNFGAQGQSVTFVSDGYCPETFPDPTQGCRVDFVDVHYTDPGHVIFSLGGSYKVTPNLSLQFNVENLLDKTYFAQVGGINGGNWYGTPRNFTVTLRGKW
jgi:outer-membrane receptor for ferric coprogen and ferric-rhodotorulic acid